MFGVATLVRANSLMEGSTIVAILLGVLLGGWLADHSLAWAFTGVMTVYGLAALANTFIPRLPAENAGASFRPWILLKNFIAALAQMFSNKDARFSLLGTSLFWGCGTTLRLMLFAWVPVALLVNDNQTPANLMGAVSIGIVAGAAMAGLWISLDNVNRALIGGLLLGPSILMLVFVNGLTSAVICMIVIGACGGLFVVPLNALLQEQGHKTIGAGNALAVQNFMENIAMLMFVGAYGLASATTPVITSVEVFGVLILLAVSALAMFRLKRA